MKRFYFITLLLTTLLMQGFVNAQTIEQTTLQKVRQMLIEAIPDSAGLSNANQRVDTLNLKVDSLKNAVDNIMPSEVNGNPDSLNDLPASSYMLKNDSLIFASRYYTDAQLLTKSNSNHNHSGVYEPSISKFTGYLRWNGTSWVFVNETYSLSTHNHSGVYQPVLVSGTNIKTVNGNSILGGGDITVANTGGTDSSAVRDLALEEIQTWKDTTGATLIATAQTLDSLVVAFWAGTLGSDTTGLWSAVNSIISGSGVTLIGTSATLDSIVTAFWNGSLGGGSTFDSTYAYQRIVTLENNVSALQDSLGSIRNMLNSILTALDTCGCGVSVVDNTPTDPPSSFVAIGGTATDQFVSTWTDPTATDLDSIRFYAGSSNDSTALVWIENIIPGAQTYAYRSLTAGTTYWAAVKAVDDSGNVSWFSPIDSATTLPTSGVTPIATLDFEEGSLTDWSSTSGANLTASTTFAHSGAYSMRVGTNSYGIRNFTSDNEVWLTFWIYLPSTSSQSASYNYISMFDNGIADRSVFATNQNGGSTWEEWLVGLSSGNMTDNDYTTNFSQNTWHKVKVYYQTNGTTTSNHQVWIDDTSIWSAAGAFVNSVSLFTVGSEAATITNWFYIDDIKLYDVDPGTQD